MDVLHVLPQVAVGGMENQVRRLVASLGKLGVAARAHACSGGDPELWSDELFPVSCDPGGGGGVGRLLRTQRLISRLDPDIVHVHLSLSGYLAARLARGPRVVSHYHSVYPDPGQMSALGLRSWKAFDRLCSGDLSIACSEAVRRQCVNACGIPETRVRLLYNGVDLHALDALAAQRPPQHPFCKGDRHRHPVLIYVGRLVAAKGLEDLLISLGRLASRRWQVVIVGDGPMASDLQRMVAERGLAGRVALLGARPWWDIPGMLSGSDLFVLPSRREGLPLSLLEASACRLPVVATDVGGVPEAVHDGVTGLLVPPGDREALGGALAQLLDDPARRREMGEAGRAIVEEKFDILKIAVQLKEMYEQLLEEAVGRQ